MASSPTSRPWWRRRWPAVLIGGATLASSALSVLAWKLEREPTRLLPEQPAAEWLPAPPREGPLARREAPGNAEAVVNDQGELAQAAASPPSTPASGRIQVVDVIQGTVAGDSGATLEARVHFEVVPASDQAAVQPFLPIIVTGVVTSDKPVLTRQATTDGRNKVEVVLPYGSYDVALAVPGAMAPVRIEVSASGVESTPTEGEEGTVSGTIVDREGKPVAGAVVRLEPPPPPDRKATAASDADGRFELGTRPGIYALEVSAPGFAQLRRGGVQVQSVRPRREDFALVRLDAAMKVVTTCDRKPCSGVEILVDWDTGQTRALTDKNGKVTLRELPPGSVLVEAVWRRGSAQERRAVAQVTLGSTGKEVILLDLGEATATSAVSPDVSSSP